MLLRSALCITTLSLLTISGGESRTHTVPRCAISPVYSHYDVRGSTPKAIRRSMLANGPRDHGGAGRFARARWKVAWSWELDRERFVDLSSVALTCSGDVLLPKLVITPETPISVIKSWHQFLERTRRHELRHLEHAEISAPRIIDDLRLAQARRGRLTPARAQEVVKRRIRQIHTLDVEYDKRTIHGKSEGAWSLG